MKKFILLTVVAALPLTLMAQDDDMYFVPTKENVAKEVKSYGMPKGTYYSGRVTTFFGTSMFTMRDLPFRDLTVLDVYSFPS